MAEVLVGNGGSNVWTGTDAGQSVTIRPGGTHTFSSACSAVQYFNANNASVVDNADGEAARQVNAMAADEGCPDRVGFIPVPTAPSAPTDHVAAGGDSPQQQGAPTAQAPGQVRVRNGPYGESGDTRQPTDAMHDRENPQSEDQIRAGEFG